MYTLRVYVYFAYISYTFGYIDHNFTLGRIRGRIFRSRDNSEFYAFLGIPFAKPPLGELRLQNPVLYEQPWSGTYDATKQAELCPQIKSAKLGYTGNEDCLYLNLYTPQSPLKATKKLPVWYFIHPSRRLFGGPFMEHYGPHYIMDYPIIFVSASYRVGALGFLSTEDDVIKGNFGFKDQTTVLMWINKYISEFGGDPNNVAISGESSGAVDVWLHTFSPLSAKLFHRSIIQSGCALNYRAIPEPGHAIRQAWRYANILGCANETIKSNENLLKCLRQLPPQMLVSFTGLLMHDYIFPHTFFGPVIEPNTEGAFMVSHPAIDIRKPNNKPILTGTVPEEGQQKVYAMYSFPTKNKELKAKARKHFLSNFHKLFAHMFSFDHLPNSDRILDTAMDRYCPNTKLEDTFYCTAKIAGFTTVHFGTLESAKLYQNRTYLYYYDHANRLGYRKVYEELFGLSGEYKYGIVHGEEMRSLFHSESLFPPTIDGDDRIVSDQTLQFFVNFIADGDPNDKRKDKIWIPASAEKLEYVHVNNLTLTPKTRLFRDEYEFWKNLDDPPLMTLRRLYRQYDSHPLHPQHRELKRTLERYL